MNFDKTSAYIESKIKELNLHYFECLVKKNGKVIYRNKFADEDKDNGLLCMYSMSKPITSVALLQLVEKGLINVDDPVNKYLDGFGNLRIIDSDEKVDKEMTISHLLTMTSGLDYNLRRNAVLEMLKIKPEASTIDICSVLAKDGINFLPGTDYRYSLSLDVIAAIVEKVSGQKYSEYVKEHIFDILLMNNSTFKNDPSLVNKTRQEYFAQDGSLNKCDHIYKGFTPSINFESGGAGLISTVDDYSLFIDSLANKTNRILADKVVDLMDRVIVVDTPFNPEVQEYSKSSSDYGYGFAVRVRKFDSEEGIPKNEFGWDGAAGSYSLCDRKNNISIVVGLSILNWPTYIKDFHIMLAKNIYRDIFNT